MASRSDTGRPFFVAFREKQQIGILTVRASLADSLFLKLENIFDKFVFLAVDRALFASRFRHHHNFFLGNFLLVLAGIDAEKP